MDRRVRSEIKDLHGLERIRQPLIRFGDADENLFQIGSIWGVGIYSREGKLRAIELYIRYDFSSTSVIRELGYPCRGILYVWYDEHLTRYPVMKAVSNLLVCA